MKDTERFKLIQKVLAIRKRAGVSDYMLEEIIHCTDLVNAKGDKLTLEEIMRNKEE